MICLRLSRVHNATSEDREELQGPAYNFVRISGKRGCPLIRACSVITSNTVFPFCLSTVSNIMIISSSGAVGYIVIGGYRWIFPKC